MKKKILFFSLFLALFALPSGAEDVTKVVVGNSQSFLIYKGNVYVWGWRMSTPEMDLDNPRGEGDFIPKQVLGLSNVQDLQISLGVNCALAKGKVKCWGRYYESRPEVVSFNSFKGEVVAFSLTRNGMCVATSHRLVCRGQILEHYKLKKYPQFVSNTEFVKEFSSPITQIAMTSKHICVISGQKVFCEGDHYFWRDPSNLFETPILGGKAFVQISGGTEYGNSNFHEYLNQFCARTQQGEVYCWGDTDFRTGQVFDLDKQIDRNSSSIFLVRRVGDFDENSPVTDVVTGDGQCFAVQGGHLYHWGRPIQGSFASPGFNSKMILSPVSVPGISNVKSIAIWAGHVCALTAEGVYCFGFNNSGQLGSPVGYNTHQFVSTPQKVEGLPDLPNYKFDTQDLSEAFKALQMITVADKSQVLMRVSKQLGSEIVTEFPSESLLERQAQVDREFANGFIILSLAPLFNDFAAEPGTEAQTDLEKVHATYQKCIHEKIGIQNRIPDLSVIHYSSAVAGAAREMLDASLRALGGVSGEANVEAYQNLLAEVSKTQDLRTVVAIVDTQREWIENTAAANQSKRCFAQMVLNITEYLRAAGN